MSLQDSDYYGSEFAKIVLLITLITFAIIIMLVLLYCYQKRKCKKVV